MAWVDLYQSCCANVEHEEEGEVALALALVVKVEVALVGFLRRAPHQLRTAWAWGLSVEAV